MYPKCDNCGDIVETTMDSKHYFCSPECHAEYRDAHLPTNDTPSQTPIHDADEE